MQKYNVKGALKISLTLIFIMITSTGALHAQQRVIEKLSSQFQSLELFGRDFFGIDSASANLPIGPVTQDYIVRVNDEIIIDIWGDLNFHWVLTVSDNGSITIPNVGRVYVNGNSFADCKQKIIRFLGNTYAASINIANPGTGSSIVDISMGKISGVDIYVTGEVVNPGVISLKSTSASIINALNYSQGITGRGSLRNITVRRIGGKTINFDLYDFLLKGSLPSELKFLENGDIIFVPVRNKEVFIQGEVRRPAIYELFEEENLQELINLAGDFTPDAVLSTVQIIRTDMYTGKEVLDLTIDDHEFNIPLRNADHVMIFSIPQKKKENVVSIEGGGVRSPGTYQYIDGMTVKDLIERANGLFPDALFDRADLIREKDDLQTDISQFNLRDALIGENVEDFKLQPMDRILTYSDYLIKGGIKQVTVRGHIKRPGNYDLHENLTLYNLMFITGGFDDPEYRKETYLDRAEIIRFDPETQIKHILPFDLGLLLLSKDNKNIVLKSGDIIHVFAFDWVILEEFVEIYGEINNPGRYVLKDDMKLSDLIYTAGNFTDNAYLERIEIQRKIHADTENQYESLFIDLSDPGNDFSLEKNDAVFVRKKPDISHRNFVTITGEVELAGEYLLIKNNETLSSIIERSGGLTENAFLEGLQFYRMYRMAFDSIGQERISIDALKALEYKGSSWDFILKSGDRIHIPMKEFAISVEGAVNFTGKIQFIEGHKTGHYIKLAGGFTDNADKRKVKIILPNGMIRMNRRLFPDPVVPFGSRIIVPEKREEEKGRGFPWIW